MLLAAKLVIALTEPLVFLALLVGFGLVLARFGRVVLARVAFGVAIVLYVAIGLTPLPEWMMRTLEDRFPAQALALDAVAGVIVLGGGTGDGLVAAERDTYLLGSAAERLTTAVGLHRRAPELPILFAGYHGALVVRGLSEGEVTRRFLLDLGLQPADFLFEERSRNTFENARESRALLAPLDGRPWLLVTSAFHMPRAVAAFRAEGFEVVPHPVDYRARRPADTWLAPSMSARFELFRLALREAVGLVSYRLLGRSDQLWPEPWPKARGDGAERRPRLASWAVGQATESRLGP